jgi:hypothetical protein
MNDFQKVLTDENQHIFIHGCLCEKCIMGVALQKWESNLLEKRMKCSVFFKNWLSLLKLNLSHEFDLCCT